MRDERAARVAHDHPRRAELRELARLLEERLGSPAPARVVDDSRVEGAARARDRRPGLAQVRDVVQRIVQTEDLDPVLRGALDETADDVAADRARADQKA